MLDLLDDYGIPSSELVAYIVRTPCVLEGSNDHEKRNSVGGLGNHTGRGTHSLPRTMKTDIVRSLNPLWAFHKIVVFDIESIVYTPRMARISGWPVPFPSVYAVRVTLAVGFSPCSVRCLPWNTVSLLRAFSTPLVGHSFLPHMSVRNEMIRLVRKNDRSLGM